MVIFDYYTNLPKGLKKILRIKISEALDISEGAILVKMRKGSFKALEEREVKKIVDEFESTVLKFVKC